MSKILCTQNNALFEFKYILALHYEINLTATLKIYPKRHIKFKKVHSKNATPLEKTNIKKWSLLCVY